MSSDPIDPDAAADVLASLDPITREAVTWLVRLRSGMQTEQDQRDYEFWRQASPAHQAASEHAERLWSMLGPALNRPFGKGPRTLPVAVIVAVGVASALFMAGIFGSPEGYFADEATGIGECRTVLLADGSRVELDTRTSLDVADGGRSLTLHAGQIFVSVAHDPAHPFVVTSGGGTTLATGTAFDVRRDDAAATVTVTEGTVRIMPSDKGAASTHADIAAGQTVTYATGQITRAPRPVDVRAATAWRQGELRFDGRPLGEVMTELGRYQRGVVIFTDDGLRRLTVTGVLQVKNINSALNAIALLAPVKIIRLPWLTIVQSDPTRANRPMH